MNDWTMAQTLILGGSAVTTLGMSLVIAVLLRLGRQLDDVYARVHAVERQVGGSLPPTRAERRRARSFS